MTKRDARVDAAIAKAPPFAKPILTYIRRTVHQACPECGETIKWGMPHFEYRGKTLCGMAAFKAHAAFILWHANRIIEDGGPTFRRITRVTDLPPRKTLAGYIRKAMALVDEGATRSRPRRRTAPRPMPRTPRDLAAALKKNANARAAFGAFPPSHKREYIEWITGAKSEQTRARRIASAVAWIAQGKPRNWKYMRT